MLYIVLTIGFGLLWGGLLTALGYATYYILYKDSAKERKAKEEWRRRNADRRGY